MFGGIRVKTDIITRRNGRTGFGLSPRTIYRGVRYPEAPESMRYNGAASRRTRAYANRGTATGMGAAVRNRMNALLQRYGNNPRNAARIMRAGGNIMARATVYK